MGQKREPTRAQLLSTRKFWACALVIAALIALESPLIVPAYNWVSRLSGSSAYQIGLFDVFVVGMLMTVFSMFMYLRAKSRLGYEPPKQHGNECIHCLYRLEGCPAVAPGFARCPECGDLNSLVPFNAPAQFLDAQRSKRKEAIDTAVRNMDRAEKRLNKLINSAKWILMVGFVVTSAALLAWMLIMKSVPAWVSAQVPEPVWAFPLVLAGVISAHTVVDFRRRKKMARESRQLMFEELIDQGTAKEVQALELQPVQ